MEAEISSAQDDLEIDAFTTPIVGRDVELAPVHGQNDRHPMVSRLRFSGESYFKICVPLRKAALEGDWKEAKRIFEDEISTTTPYSFTDMLHMAITKGKETILHVAAGAGQTTFVKEILNSTGPDDHLLTLQDENKNNAFIFAVAKGHKEIAELMLERNLDLPTVRVSGEKTPLYMAVLFGQHEMATFLYDKTVASLSQKDLFHLFFKSITTGLYDIALKLLDDHPYSNLEVIRYENEAALQVLARKPSAFADKSTGLFKTLINSLPSMKFNCNTNSMKIKALELVKRLRQKLTQLPDQDFADQIFNQSLFDAAKLGNFEFLAELVRSYPDLIHRCDEKQRTIFHIAILYRQPNIFNLIYEMGFDKNLLATFEDDDNNNMLHLASIYPNPPPASVVPGAALELQRELLMFEKVEMLMQPSLREMKNSEGCTPKELFTKNHKELRKIGEEWMRSTANSCMLVATLIATVVFTSSFTVPGGNDDKIGRPIHLNQTLFKVFVMSDAIALSSSCTSILMFLSILTSRYAEQDFLMSLPYKLMVGLLTLFISIITMMIAFSSSFFLFYPYHERKNWIAMSTAVLVIVPILLYCYLQYPLLRDIFYSRYCSRDLFKRK